MEGEGVKDYLRDIGRDVASSLGEALKGVAKEKATSFVKEQFGLGQKGLGSLHPHRSTCHRQ